MLQAVGPPDIVFLFEYIGQVLEDATYEVAIETIRAGITAHTNQAMMMFKLFTVIPQEGQTYKALCRPWTGGDFLYHRTALPRTE